jgi:hypothetical protein
MLSFVPAYFARRTGYPSIPTIPVFHHSTIPIPPASAHLSTGVHLLTASRPLTPAVRSLRATCQVPGTWQIAPTAPGLKVLTLFP